MPVSEINQPYSLDNASISRFREDGFIRLPKVFCEETLSHYTPTLNRLVDEKNPQANKPLKERSLYDQAFIQAGNLWDLDEQAKEFVFNKRLARIATELLGTEGVRIWHDQALYKEPSGGFTPWHVDQQYWPMDSSLSVTAWIPMQPVPLEMGPLCFGRGSHRKKVGHDLEISAGSEKVIPVLHE